MNQQARKALLIKGFSMRASCTYPSLINYENNTRQRPLLKRESRPKEDYQSFAFWQVYDRKGFRGVLSLLIIPDS